MIKSLNKNYDLSIVIPAYNEATKIHDDIKNASIFLVKNNINGEILIVDDGSEDNTAQIAKFTLSEIKTDGSIVTSNRNHGKGHAVKSGILNANGDIIMFIDSGGCFDLDDALDGIAMIKDNRCDISHGSRRLKKSKTIKKRELLRSISSFIFKWFVTIIMNLPRHLTDTQCGIKIFEKNIAKELFSKCVITSYIFDIEIIMRATRSGYKILEFPIKCRYDRDSRMRPFKLILQIMSDLIKIKKAVKKPQK